MGKFRKPSGPAGAGLLLPGPDAPTPARVGTGRPKGRSHFSFGGERKVCKRKPAARRLREKALYCPFWRRGSLCRAQRSWPATPAIVRARSSPFSAVKMGNRSLFPVVAVPLCFLWYFLSLRKKVLPPRGGSPTVRAGVGASSPSSGRCMPTGAPEGFPRGKQSARFALPCAPLVVCLNSESLTAFGGCIHWMTVNFSNLI